MSGIITMVEVAFVEGLDVPVEHRHADRLVVLRDADDPDGDSLYYTGDEWEAFVLGVKEGEFDDMAAGPQAPPGGERVVALRDSKDPEGPMLFLALAAWTGLLDSIRSAAHELPADMRELLHERFQ